MSATTATKVLVIDDDCVAQSFIAASLKQKFDVDGALNGDEGIAKARDWQPQLILMDVEMPGKNGYEVCDIIKSGATTAEIPVVFLSSRSGLRERLLGYEVGAEDFLTKPIDAELLNIKVERFTETHIKKSVLVSEIDYAKKTALDAITDNSEMGKAIRFVEKTFTIGHFDQLAQHLFYFLADLGLHTSVLFRLADSVHCYSPNREQPSPLEQELMLKLHSDKRFYDFGCRTQINYTNVALLIKNMPLEDRVRYGRIKDLLPFVLAATDEKARILDAEQTLRNQASNLSRSVVEVKGTLTEITRDIKKNQQGMEKTIRQLLYELEETLPEIGLEEDQESYVIKKVDDAFNQASLFIEDNLNMRVPLLAIVRLLNYLTEEQKQIVDIVVNRNNIRHGDNDELNNIELF